MRGSTFGDLIKEAIEMHRKIFQTAFLFTLAAHLTLHFASTVRAADILASNLPDCRVQLIGKIESGDFDKILALKDQLVVNNGESTSGSTICLDSPGGNLVEGLKIARFFLDEGVGTRLQEGAECQSVCAIMFMMGNAKGGEVSFLDRRMHANSTLGFHRPYISIQEASSYTSGDIELAYDLGIGSVYELIALANSPAPWQERTMIDSDLLEYMIGTPGTEMMEIRTVEQALRWQIEVEGIESQVELSRPQIMFACENSLATGFSLTSNRNGDGIMTDEIFNFSAPNLYSIENATVSVTRNFNGSRFLAVSPRAGYSSISCEVAPLSDFVAICGYDEGADKRIGDCRAEDDLRFFDYLFAQHPRSDLRALSVMEGKQTDAITFRRCRVFSTSGAIEDDEVCLHGVSIVAEGEVRLLRHTLFWSSGARTVVDIHAGSEKVPTEVVINGNPGEISKTSDAMYCVKNVATGKMLCSDGP